MSSEDCYVVMELYHNVHDYTSFNEQVQVLKAICPSSHDAAEIIAKAKIQEMQRMVDNHNAGKPMTPFKENMFVVKVPQNTIVDTNNLPKLSVTEGDLSQDTVQQMHAVTEAYNGIFSKNMTSGDSTVGHLRVDPSLYEKDRRAREYELMQRLHIRPLWRGNVRVPVTPPNSGRIPQPATHMSIQGATPGMADELKTIPNSKVPTPSTSAPTALPGLLPVTHQVPNPVGVNNLRTNSAGQIYGAPPQNTASTDTSRVTGI